MNITTTSKVLLLFTALILAACQTAVPSVPSPIPTLPSPATSTSTPIPFPTPTRFPTLTPSVTPLPTATLAPVTDFIKGAWFVDWGLGPGEETLDGTQVLKDIIVPLGANWISLTVMCRMNVQDPSGFECDPDDDMSYDNIRRVTQTAHSLGLRVALFAFVLDVAGVPDNWSANLDYGSEQEKWFSFFEGYAGELIPYAKLAEENQIDLLIVGGEQTGTQKQEAHWRAMIDKVRNVYHGPITYEAWCDTSGSVKWWDAVDYIGINFYCFPLSHSNTPSDDEVKRNYLKFLQMVKDQTAGWDRQVIFTEIGYESIHGVAQIVPFGLTPVRLDVEEQGILVKNFFEALKEFGNEDQWLKGMFWYNFTSSPYIGGMGDLNFTPHNKPAEVYLKAFYTGQEPGQLPELPTQVDETRLENSYWLFSDQLENGTIFGPWAGNGKATIVPDPLKNRGNVIRVDISGHWDGLHLDLSPVVDFREYDFLELYLYASKYEPNLEVWSDNFKEMIERPWLYIRSYIDREPLMNDSWHRISIPIDLLFPADRPGKISKTSSVYFIHMWPGEARSFSFFIDDVRLVKAVK